MEPAKAADLVAKLRAKAASTTFPAEAKLLTAKADKLCRRYHITERAPEPPSRPAPNFIWDMDRESMWGTVSRVPSRRHPQAPTRMAGGSTSYGDVGDTNSVGDMAGS
jgi:hypothetical protein